MRIGTQLPYAGDFAASVDQLQDYHRAGVSIAYVAEAYSFDAVSQLGYLAARIPDIEIAPTSCPSTPAPPPCWP